MEYYAEGQHLKESDRDIMEADLLKYYLDNMEDNYEVIKEALEHLLSDAMGNSDILRAHDEAFKNRWRR